METATLKQLAVEVTQAEGVAAVLLGLATTPAEVGSIVEVHDRLLEGLSFASLKHLLAQLKETRSDPELMSVLGLASLPDRSSRNRLSPRQSSLAWTFARLLVRATRVFGDQSAAESWIYEPVMALNRRSPIELMTTSVGTQAIDDQLTRMEFGVFA